MNGPLVILHPPRTVKVRSEMARPVIPEGAHRGWKHVPRCLISRFQRRRHIEFRLQEQSHFGQYITHGQRFQVGHPGRTGIIGRHDQGLVRRQLKIIFLKLIPDSLGNSPRFALTWRKKIDQEKMNTLVQEIGRLLDSGPKLCPAALVARRDDLDHSDDLAVPVLDRDAIGLVRVDIGFGSSNEARSGRSDRDHQASCTTAFQTGVRRQVQGQNIRNRTPNALFGKGKVSWRQPSGIQCLAQSTDPLLVEGVK